MTKTAVKGQTRLFEVCESCGWSVASYLVGFGTAGTPFLICRRCLPVVDPPKGTPTITTI